MWKVHIVTLFCILHLSTASDGTFPPNIPSYIHPEDETDFLLGIKVFRLLKQAVFFKPPIGIAFLLGTYHRLQQLRHWKIDSADDLHENGDIRRFQGIGKRNRDLFLDEVDERHYRKGTTGVDHVRSTLCIAALDTPETRVLLRLPQVSSSRADLLQKMTTRLSATNGAATGKTRGTFLPRRRQPHVNTTLSATAHLSNKVQLVDALLRMARDRALKSAMRLKKTELHWIRRSALPSRHSDAAMQLALTRAALDSELSRVGRICTLLGQRPADMATEYLVSISTGKRGQHSPELAKSSLVEHLKCMSWVEAADSWTTEGQVTLGRTIGETLKSCQQGKSPNMTTTMDALRSPAQQENNWVKLYQCLNDLSTWKRIGENHYLSILELLKEGRGWFQRNVDFLGIPSLLLQVYFAYVVHETLLPVWPFLIKQGEALIAINREIFQTRVWQPLKAIIDEIMNRDEGMMSAFSLEDEQNVLDNMLRDMGFGTGNTFNRDTALHEAGNAYEQEIQGTRLFANMATGRLVRMMLVQVQQLKVGLVSALETIDVLIQGNKIHFQILAIIPAIWMATYGSRFVIRLLSSVRSTDVRPFRSVHGEMTECLDNLQSLFLRIAACQASQPTIPDLQLGELHLYVYRYLTLLEYGRALFPDRECDQVRSALQELVSWVLQGTPSPGMRWELEKLGTIQQRQSALLRQ